MALNTNYTYTVTVNPPDKISKVVNAIISLNAQVNGQTQTFSLWVNNKICNTPTYSIATAFSTTGNVQIYFDCSNVITQAGTYTVVLRSAVNTGAITGWLDVTYMNDPQGKMDIFGTEYYQDDDGTLFLLLKDSSGVPITNATCDVTIYYPNLPNQQHPVWINKGQMQYKENGIYYYDFVAPALSGLYMTNAECRYVTQHSLYYTSASGKKPTRTTITGTYTGDTFVLDDYTDWLYTQCDSATSGGSKSCDSVYDWTVDTNITDLYVNYMGENTIAATLTLSVWNWSSNTWVAFPNTMTFHATASGVPSGVDEYVSNKIPDLTHIIAGNLSVRIRTTTTAGSMFKLFTNWLQLDASKFSTTAQDLKGSGEIHVNSIIPSEVEIRFYDIQTCNGHNDGRCMFFTNDDEFDVPEGELEDYFNFTGVNTKTGHSIVYYTPFSVDCTALDWIKQFNGTSWNDFTDYDVYSQPALENCLIQLNINLEAGKQYDFWIKTDNYMKWEVDFTKQIADKLNASISELCSDRNFTYANPITDTTIMPTDQTTLFCYYALDDIFYVNQFYEDSQSVVLAGEYASYVEEMRFYRSGLYDRFMLLSLDENSTQLPKSIWQYPKRTLSTVYANMTAADVWNHNQRNLTFYPVHGTSNLTAQQVWTAAERNLTYYPIVSTSNLTASDVWGYGARNLTWFPTYVNPANDVWTYVNRSLTFYSDVTNYTAIYNGVWLSPTRTLTDYATTSIATAIWIRTDRNLTYYQYTNPASDVWNYVSRNLTWFPPYQNPATDVWNYNQRNLTYTVYTNPAGDIWTYSDRNLTYYYNPTVDIWNYTARYTHGEVQ
jgi:hypothetical protein